MQHTEMFVPVMDWVRSGTGLLVAFGLGTVIGYERQYRQRTAGLRTNTLVALSAAIFVDLAYQLDGPAGASHVAAYVVSGVGFLGAGTIMKDGAGVRGLNTAATLWGSAAAGACAGASLIGEAVMATLLVLAANTLLRPVQDAINRRPISAASSEVGYVLSVIASAHQQKDALALLEHQLAHSGYALGEVAVLPFGDDDVDITAALVGRQIETPALDRITTQLITHSFIKQAFWNPQSVD